LAEFRDGHLTVWTHCQGVFPLRAALVKTLGLEASAITVHHVQGSGCYGHNGADDAAADAAIIAMQMPGVPVRVRWRREEEFIYEPKTPTMIVKVHALLDDAGKPADWTQEIWSPTHNQRPGAGGNLLGALVSSSGLKQRLALDDLARFVGISPAETLAILAEEHVADVGGIMHCFSGDVEIARRCLDLGLLISLAGPVTYPNARALPAVAKFVPADRLVIETDCPFLPPQPYRGKRNEPAYLTITASRVAELRGESLETLAARLTDNALRLFGLA